VSPGDGAGIRPGAGLERRAHVPRVQGVHLEGNLIELAVAVILGLAFNVVVQSLVADVFTPLIAAVFGEPDFSSITIQIGDGVIRIGSFLNALISFVIVGFVLFLVVKAYNRLLPKMEEETAPTEVELLRQIRDDLRLR
jgi:large conductance mechanosensitive channel